MKRLLILLTTLLFNSAYADVWKTKNDWSEEYELKYQNWIKNDGFHKRIFSDSTSPYYGVPTDCADIIYAARIIFSFENKLPFKVLNPARKGIFSAKYISNTGNYFNSMENEIDRVKAFISKLAVHSGTTILAQTDTYPIAISDIRSGDIYVTKANGIRHAYLIKSVSNSGIFDLYYSTVPRVVREIKFHRGLPLFSFDSAPWGFRRFKKPNEVSLEVKEIDGFSNEQYELLNKVGSTGVLEYISDMLRTEDESIEGRLDRVISNICRSMNDRVDAIKKAEVYVREIINGRCVNKSEYDNYSTPGLDNRIFKQITTLQKFYSKIVNADLQLNISNSRYIVLEELLNEESSKVKLCEDSVSPITITTYFKRYKNKTLSSHPNDTESARWGESVERTDCKLFNSL
ncbi:hypothetical protein [Bacteriovorax sp. Seq25_V]|uniref:hypothetical protein n=1 Tax=Bacteriovorax sp. Seq25_V TaxID=1201288 RepID=UPI00038A280C|nr:hypothetical protein [Bacteriovorax sp. Seq25_V]EQC43994.1 hypothetical protein M900_1531 [Bacteriovorax sp. Seq25_V]